MEHGHPWYYTHTSDKHKHGERWKEKEMSPSVLLFVYRTLEGVTSNSSHERERERERTVISINFIYVVDIVISHRGGPIGSTLLLLLSFCVCVR